MKLVKGFTPNKKTEKDLNELVEKQNSDKGMINTETEQQTKSTVENNMLEEFVDKVKVTRQEIDNKTQEKMRKESSAGDETEIEYREAIEEEREDKIEEQSDEEIEEETEEETEEEIIEEETEEEIVEEETEEEGEETEDNTEKEKNERLTTKKSPLVEIEMKDINQMVIINYKSFSIQKVLH